MATQSRQDVAISPGSPISGCRGYFCPKTAPDIGQGGFGYDIIHIKSRQLPKLTYPNGRRPWVMSVGVKTKPEAGLLWNFLIKRPWG